MAADCAPFAAGDFHARYLQGKALFCGCPEFDNLEEYVVKLTAILKENNIQEITIVNMECPAASGWCRWYARPWSRSQDPAGHHLYPGDPGDILQQQKVRGK